MKTLNVQVDNYSSRMLEIIKAVYGLPNKSAAFNTLVHEFGPKMVEPELTVEFAQKVLKDTKTWEKKHGFKRKTTLAELEAL